MYNPLDPKNLVIPPYVNNIGKSKKKKNRIGEGTVLSVKNNKIKVLYSKK